MRRLETWIILADRLGTYRSTTVAVCAVLNSGRTPKQTASLLRLPLPFVERISEAAQPLLRHSRKVSARRLIKHQAEGICHYCGAPSQDLQIDHVIPRSRGGSDSPENLVACCKNCNSAKGDRTPEEWLN